MVDDDPFTSSTLASSLQMLGCYVVAAESVSSALRAIRNFSAENAPNVALLDLDLGEGPTGLDLAVTLREEFPTIGIVILSTYVDPRLIGGNQPDLPEGAIYVIKNSVTKPQVLGDALQSAVAHMSNSKSETQKISAVVLAGSNLSDKQVEMMRLVAAGLTNAEIAKQLWMTEPAVEKAIARLSKKLDISASKEQNQRVMITNAFHRLTGSATVRNDS
jgi:DNA-binding NarL/FixJ family response regulator